LQRAVDAKLLAADIFFSIEFLHKLHQEGDNTLLLNHKEIVYIIQVHVSQRISNLVPCSRAMLSQCVTCALIMWVVIA